MRMAVMKGSVDDGALSFTYQDDHLLPLVAFITIGPRGWHWVAEGKAGVTKVHQQAIDRVVEILAAKQVAVHGLDQLERSDDATRATWYASACGLLILLVLTLISIGGCGVDARPAPKTHRWKQYPITAVLSKSLDACRRASIMAGIVWWETRLGGQRFTLVDATEDSLSLSGTPAYGTVEFSALPPMAPAYKQVATTEVVELASDPKFAHSAQIRSHSCSVRAYTHEIGHALGLGHAINGMGKGTRQDLLMDIKHQDTWGLLPVELADL